MKIILKALLILFLTTCCAGCIPRVHILAPGITGTVTDSATGKSIKGATILGRYTNEEGHFTVPAKKELGLTFPFVGGHYLIETPFAVSAVGYETRTCRCTVVAPAPLCGEVRIPLQKLSPEKDQDKMRKGHIVIATIDDKEPAEGGVTCRPLRGETTIAELEDAASNGSNSALYKLGVRYLQGINVKKNRILGRYFLEQAAEKSNPEAIDYFTSRAHQGDLYAIVFVGDLLYFGNGLPQDVKRGMQWYMAAVAEGSSRAMLRLGEAYSANEFIRVNQDKALYWYKAAAEAGLSAAMFQLGEIYRYNELVFGNFTESFDWYIKAADAGHDRARIFLIDTANADDIPLTEKQPAIDWLNRAER